MLLLGLSFLLKACDKQDNCTSHSWSLQTISIVFFTDSWRPDSFYSRIASNRKHGLHTLCLLDIKVKEPTLESLARGKKVYEPARYMSIKTAIEQLLEVEDKLQVILCYTITLCKYEIILLIVLLMLLTTFSDAYHV